MLTLNFFPNFHFKETRPQLSVWSSRLKYASSTSLLVWKPHISFCSLTLAYVFLSLSSCFWKAPHESRVVAGISLHPEEHETHQIRPPFPKNCSWEVFGLTAAWESSGFLAVWRRACYSSSARVCFFLPQSVISGVGRGASSRPHRWHSCPCSTHNTKPLVARRVYPHLQHLH